MSEIMYGSEERTFDSFCVVNSNVRALDSALRFAAGINPFVVIIGPTGWGKTHILEAAAKRFEFDSRQLKVPVISAQDWLSDSRLKNNSGPLILDNTQDLANRTRSRIQLRLMLERRVKAGKPTLLSFMDTKLSRTTRESLPQFHDWVVATIKAPSTTERERIVKRMAESEHMRLSETLIQLLASKIEGNGRTYMGALKRLRLTQSSWTDTRATLRACGVLNPFFGANSGWDLREHIAEVAKEIPAIERQQTEAFDLAIFAMLRIALLVEADVAKFFRIEPAKAFSYANRFSDRIQKCEHTAEVTEKFVERVVARL